MVHTNATKTTWLSNTIIMNVKHTTTYNTNTAPTIIIQCKCHLQTSCSVNSMNVIQKHHTLNTNATRPTCMLLIYTSTSPNYFIHKVQVLLIKCVNGTQMPPHIVNSKLTCSIYECHSHGITHDAEAVYKISNHSY